MMCQSPFVRDPSGKIFKLYVEGSVLREELHKGIPFPCGQCLACRINKRREWTARLMLESLMHDSTCFLTLTYDPDHCPETLQKRDIQLFLKRLRAALDNQIRYYICGEYGEKSHRPHYHAILYGVPEALLSEQFFERFWCEEGKGNIKRSRLGMCHLGYDASLSAVQYVAGYVTKKFVKRSGWDVDKEFAVMSRKPAIGSQALKILADAIKGKSDNTTTVRFGNRIFPLGRTLSDKLGKLLGIDYEDKRDLFYEDMLSKFIHNFGVRDCDPYAFLNLLVNEDDSKRKRAYRLHKLFNHREAV